MLFTEMTAGWLILIDMVKIDHYQNTTKHNRKAQQSKNSVYFGKAQALYIDGLLQDCIICSALTMGALQSSTKPSIAQEILQSCTEPLICIIRYGKVKHIFCDTCFDLQ